MKYRIYADGHVIDEDEWEAFECVFPLNDDYRVVDVPGEIIDHILSD